MRDGRDRRGGIVGRDGHGEREAQYRTGTRMAEAGTCRQGIEHADAILELGAWRAATFLTRCAKCRSVRCAVALPHDRVQPAAQ